jgi:hypothetical protein
MAPKLMKHLSYICFTAAIAISILPATARAETAAELAKKLSNPISSMISVPFQFSYTDGYGPFGVGGQVKMNIQPVIPISLNDEWNLISRTIVPVIKQWDFFQDDFWEFLPSQDKQFGIGDTLQSLWLSPVEPTNGIIWGIGPVIYIPTATDHKLGVGKWGAGPTVIALTQDGPWTIGALGNHVWTLGGSEINNTYLQPFLSYSTPDAWTYALNVEATHNWNNMDWSIPVIGSVAKLVDIGGQKVSFQVGAGYYANSATNGANGWLARFQLTFLFPK